MTAHLCTHRSLRSDDEGQGLAEYALILALIAIVAIIALIFLGGQVSQDPQHRRQLGLGRSRPASADGQSTTRSRRGSPVGPLGAIADGPSLRRTRSLPRRVISCHFLLMVLALWYSRAAFGAMLQWCHLSHALGESNFEAIESADPARRDLPGRRRVRRGHRALLNGERQRTGTATAPPPPTHRPRSSSRPSTSRSATQITAAMVDDQARSRSRPTARRRASATPSDVIGQIVRPHGQRQRPDLTQSTFTSTGPRPRRHADSSSTRACAPWPSRSTRSPASAR